MIRSRLTKTVGYRAVQRFLCCPTASKETTKKHLGSCFSTQSAQLNVHVSSSSSSSSSSSQRALEPATENNITTLVDNLLSYTRQLMGPPPDQPTTKTHTVAYSGGIDSTLVAALLNKVAVEPQEHIQAVIGISPALPKEQLQLARRIVENDLNMDYLEVQTREGSDDTYIANQGQACFVCKTHLYSTLESVFRHVSKQHNNTTVQLYNGTNADDLHDETRVGLVAAQNYQVQSPLRYTTKEQVRLVAKHLGLSNWNVAAAPCLRSRLALGVTATQTHLAMVEQAERHVRHKLKLSPQHNLRVRMLAQESARIEVDAPVLESALVWMEDFREHLCALGFSSVSIRAFRSGSVATTPYDSTNHHQQQQQQVGT